MTDPNTIKLENVRLSFPDLGKPAASIVGGALKYRASFIIDPTTPHGKANIARILEAKKNAEMAEWKKSPMPFKEGRCTCLEDGNNKMNQQTGDIYDGYAGMKICSASSDRPPVLVDRKRTPVVGEKEIERMFYGGCYVNAVVRLYTVTGADKGGNGIFGGLQAVQFCGEGDAFGAGSVDPNEVFEDLEDLEDFSASDERLFS